MIPPDLASTYGRFRWLLLSMLLALTVGCVSTEHSVTPPTEWLSSAAYQERFDAEVVRGYYRVRVEGRLREGRSQYRASFEAFPTTSFWFYSHHGFREGHFLARDAELKALGYRRVWTQDFTDASGGLRFQATWVYQPKG